MRAKPATWILATGFLPGFATADITYATWDTSTATSNSVQGSLTMGDGTEVDVTLTGPLFFVQGETGTVYWSNPETYEGEGVPNAPETPDIVAIFSGDATYTFTFSQPVFDLVMPVVSLGRSGTPVQYEFSRDFELISEGPGYFGSGTLSQPSGNILAGEEGNGTIFFDGTFSSFSWTVDEAENWHGFTLGVGGAVPEPASMTALAAGGALVLLRRRRRS